MALKMIRDSLTVRGYKVFELLSHHTYETALCNVFSLACPSMIGYQTLQRQWHTESVG